MTEISNWAVNIGNAAPPPPPPTGGVHALPGQVLASEYGALTGTMKLEPCSDVGGGEDVGYTSVGGTLQYQVSVATAGSFNASYRVAALQGGSFDVLIDGNEVDTITVATTGGWQSWTTVNGHSAYAIGAGTHTVQITVDSTAYNLNWIDFTATASCGDAGASYAATCSNCSVAGTTLTCDCRSESQTSAPTSINMCTCTPAARDREHERRTDVHLEESMTGQPIVGAAPRHSSRNRILPSGTHQAGIKARLGRARSRLRSAR